MKEFTAVKRPRSTDVRFYPVVSTVGMDNMWVFFRARSLRVAKCWSRTNGGLIMVGKKFA